MLLSLALACVGFAEPGRDLNELLQQLRHKDVATRLQGLARAAELGPKASAAIPVLVSMLEERDEDVRLNSSLALGKMGQPAVEPLTRALSHKLDHVRHYAAWSLGWIGPEAKPAAPALARLLKEDGADNRRKAAFALGRIQPEGNLGAPALVACFGDPDQEVRQALIEAVVLFKERATPALAVALEHKDAIVRQQSLAALRRLGPAAKEAMPGPDKILRNGAVEAPEAAAALAAIGPNARKVLASHLNSPHVLVRNKCLAALATLGVEATSNLVAALGSPHADLRRHAATILGNPLFLDDAVVAGLAGAIKDQDENVRREALVSLSKLGVAAQKAGPALLDGALEAKPEMRALAFQTARALKHDLQPALRKMLAHDALPLRLRAAEVLVLHYQERLGLTGVLREGVASQDEALRFQAAFLLGHCQEEPDLALPVLLAMQQAKEDNTRGLALGALKHLAGVEPKAIPPMIAALADGNHHIRYHAALWLGDLGPRAREALPGLERTLKDSHTDVQFMAVWAVPKVGGDLKLVLPAVRELMKNEKTQHIVVYHLNQKGPEWVPHLLALLDDADAKVRYSAAEILGNRREAKAMERLAKMAVEDADPLPRRIAVPALSSSGNAAIPHILKTLRSKDGDVRNAAINALTYSWADRKLTVPGLIAMLDDPSPTTRGAVIYALELTRQPARPALPALRKLLKDPDGTVRYRAQEAISAIDQ